MRFLAALMLLGFLPAGCTYTRESNPQRTATEQLLISTAVDRAVEGLDLKIPRASLAFLDTANFDGYDSKYAVASVEERILRLGGRVTDKRDKVDLVLALRAGALSTDSDKVLVGLPAVGVPVPMTGNLSLPEIALYAKSETRGVAKFAATVYDQRSGELRSASGASYGLSRKTHWVLLFVSGDRNDAVPGGPQP